MNPHLNAQQISEWLIGDRTPEAARHVGECEACLTEIHRMESALGMFRESARAWSDAQPQAAVWNIVAPRRRVGAIAMRWAAVAAVCALLLAIPVYRNQQAARQRAEIARQDAALMAAIDADLSNSVPQPLKPLQTLMQDTSSKAVKQ